MVADLTHERLSLWSIMNVISSVSSSGTTSPSSMIRSASASVSVMLVMTRVADGRNDERNST